MQKQAAPKEEKPKERVPLWHDSDDDEIEVDISARGKRKRMRNSYKEKRISGTEYSKRLQAQQNCYWQSNTKTLSSERSRVSL